MRTALLLVALLAAATTVDARTDDRSRRDRELAAQVLNLDTVFHWANVMAGALRLLDVPPDGLDRLPATKIVQAHREP